MVDTPHLETALVHAGEPSPRIGGAANTPIFQNTVFEMEGEAGYHDILYPRLNNLANHQVLAGKLSRIEGGESALVFASGMGAISTSLLSILGQGDQVLVQDCVYGGTHSLLTGDLPTYGIGHDFIDATRPDTWEQGLKPGSKAIYVEAISNPLMQVADHEAVVAFAKAHGLVSMVDATFATPVNFRPLSIGYDLVLHSATKYLNGHSDQAAGVAVGSADRIEAIKHRLDHLGACLDPHGCFLLTRGLKTLALRVRQQNQSALALAEHLAAHKAVEVVNYPGLNSHPAHAISTKLFDGFGGMLSFVPCGGADAAEAICKNVRLLMHAPSLGGPESLITRPATSSHHGMPRAERERQGISDALVRVSTGIEHVDDLITDLDQALAQI
jgi:cystathionine beta-lyase/cystathionine gamma-synthase